MNKVNKVFSLTLIITILINVVTVSVFASESYNVKKYNSNLKLTNSNDKIPENALFYDGHYYCNIESGLTWYQAQNYCIAQGGYLATITSEFEQAIVDLLLARGSKPNYWIGGFNENNTWYWVTGENFNLYSNWAENQPDNWNSCESCLMLFSDKNPDAGTFLGGWNDANPVDTENFGFICEWEEAVSPTPTPTPNDPVSLNSIKIKSKPNKLNYNIGQSFSSSGLTVIAQYSDGTSKLIQANDCTLSGYNMNQAGTQTVNVSYTENNVTKTTRFSITVKTKSSTKSKSKVKPKPKVTVPPQSIAIKTKPKKTKYNLGDKFIPVGLTVTAKYSNGKSKTISVGSCSISGYNKNKSGKQKITVKYGGKLTSFNIIVKALPTAKLSFVKAFTNSLLQIKAKAIKGIGTYEYYISESKNFKKGTICLKTKKRDLKYQFLSLKGKTIYVKARCVKKVGKKTYYGAWSNIKRTVIK